MEKIANKKTTFSAKINIGSPKCTEEEGGGVTSLGLSPKIYLFLVLPYLTILFVWFDC